MEVYWLEQDAADVPSEDDWLGAGEADRLNGMRFAKRRADWRLGRWTAKRALAAYLKLPEGAENLATIEIRAAPCGAPEGFIRGWPAAATISLSHSAGVGLCAVAPPGTMLGCDLERVEQRSAAFAADYFTDEEQALVAETPAPDQPRLLTLLWSGKESVLKALRTGLRLDTRSVSVRPVGALADAGELYARCDDGQVFRGWWEATGGLLRTLVAGGAAILPNATTPALVDFAFGKRGRMRPDHSGSRTPLPPARKFRIGENTQHLLHDGPAISFAGGFGKQGQESVDRVLGQGSIPTYRRVSPAGFLIGLLMSWSP